MPSLEQRPALHKAFSTQAHIQPRSVLIGYGPADHLQTVRLVDSTSQTALTRQRRREIQRGLRAGGGQRLFRTLKRQVLVRQDRKPSVAHPLDVGEGPGVGANRVGQILTL